MKKVIVSAIVIVGLAATMSYAHNSGWNGFHMMGGAGGPSGSFGCGGYGMQPSNQNFMDKTVELRKQMHELRFDYMEAHRDPATSRGDLAKIEQKMLELRNQMSGVGEINSN